MLGIEKSCREPQINAHFSGRVLDIVVERQLTVCICHDHLSFFSCLFFFFLSSSFYGGAVS